MKRTERYVIYTALAALGASNLVFLLSSTGQNAFAEAANWLDALGPAESLKLVDGEKELVLKNADGKLTWGDGDFRKTYTVGFVDISRALNPLMEGEALKEERDQLRVELEEVEKDYKARLDAFGQELQTADRESPEGQAKLAEARKLYEEYMEWGQKAVVRRNEMDVQHLQKCYRELTSAVDVVSDNLGVDIVLRFIPTEKDFKAADAEQALTDIRLRTALKYPTDLDITSEVLKELSITETEG